MLTWLADALRREGLTVHEVPGWKTRGGSAIVPVGAMFHHTAGPPSGVAPSLNIIVNGRTGLPGPLANVLVGRNGHVWVVAAGRANHAGLGGPWREVALNAGNGRLVGVEVENTGTGEPWRPVVLDACDKVFAAVLKRLNRDHTWVVGHYEYTTRKIDPALCGARCGMPAYRTRLRQYMEGDDLAFLDERQQKFLANFADQGMKNFNGGGGMATWVFRARNGFENMLGALGANNFAGLGTRVGHATKRFEDGDLPAHEHDSDTGPDHDHDDVYAKIKHPHDASTTVS